LFLQSLVFSDTLSVYFKHVLTVLADYARHMLKSLQTQVLTAAVQANVTFDGVRGVTMG